MLNVLFAAPTPGLDTYRAPLMHAFDTAGLQVNLREDFAPEDVDYIVYAPSSPLQDFTPYTRTRAVLSLWAGVEKIAGNTTLTQPLCRMVDHGLERGMVEWVAGQVLRHHLGLDACLAAQDGTWQPQFPPLARDRPVTVLGLGELGRICATTLASLGFPVTGWSRSPRQIEGVTCLSGADGLPEALAQAQILVLLLPLTPETRDLMNAERLALLPHGAVIVNPGRGPLIVDEDLIAALGSGQIGHATLDVFRTEPLPADHPFWSHPKVTVTPHVAARTRPETASEVVAENIRRGEAGQPLLYRVDRTRGY